MSEFKQSQVPENARAAGWYDDEARRSRESGRCFLCYPSDKYVIAREDQWYLTANKFPRSKANLMIVPQRHIEHLHQLTPEDALARQNLEQLGQSLLKESFGITDVWFLLRDGESEIAAGKTVPHLHEHILTYYHGILKWESDRDNLDRPFRSPEEAGFSIIPAVDVAQTLRQAITRRKP